MSLEPVKETSLEVSLLTETQQVGVMSPNLAMQIGYELAGDLK